MVIGGIRVPIGVLISSRDAIAIVVIVEDVKNAILIGVLWVCHIADLSAITVEPRMPGYGDVGAYINASTFKNWDALADWYRQLVKPQLELSGDIAKTARGLASGAKDVRGKVAAILAWVPFAVGWADIATGGESPRVGLDVVVSARRYGVHFAAPCRVIETDESADSFGFTYGTLPGHIERGEERFRVTRLPATGEVFYEIHVMAAPGIWFAKPGRLIVERHRRGFRAASAAAMARFVTAGAR